MQPFMDKDFLLATDTAKKLYHDYAKAMPIADYHCHVNPQEIYEDLRFNNIHEAWLAGDHYKWRLMRWGGVDEEYITGGAPARAKFQKFAEVLPRAIGNPLYHWCHLELKRYFGYEGNLNGETAQEVWDLCQKKFSQQEMSVRGLINQSNVAFIGTTDDPIDSLEWHTKLAKDPSFKTIVAPSFRPDKAINIEKDGWGAYISSLQDASGIKIDSVSSLKEALFARMKHFDTAGCKASDHGLDYVPFRLAEDSTIEKTFQKAISGGAICREDVDAFKTDLLLFCGRTYTKIGWAMQIHYNCARNPNTAMFDKLGPDTGFDCMNAEKNGTQIAALLNQLYKDGELPRVILYSLNPTDNEMLASIAGAFQGGGVRGRVQHGSGWWYNDTKSGMIAQMTSLANLGVLGDFVGMLTDSRSFLSYTRHEYFRRILCNMIGTWVENGEYPADMPMLEKLVKDISYRNAAQYFSIAAKTIEA